MKPDKTAQQLVDKAQQSVTTLSPEAAAARRERTGVVFVDVRDVRERKREGYIPGSLHVPRGMIEFWIDPDSPYHKPELAEADELILYCNKGWRSALAAATLADMGVAGVAHVAGGFERWRNETGVVTRD